MSLLVLDTMTIMLCGSHMHRNSTPHSIFKRSESRIAFPHCSTIAVRSPSLVVTWFTKCHGKNPLPGEWLSYQCFTSTQEYPMCGGVAEFPVGIRSTLASAVQGMPLLSQLIPDKSTKECASVAGSYDCAGVPWCCMRNMHLISVIRSDKP